MKNTLANVNVKNKSVPFLEIIPKVLLFLAVSLAFLISLELMINTLKIFGENEISTILSATANPFIALFVGLLATAIVQSSSLVTSLIVAMVAVGTLNLSSATYIVIGANVGTTITCMIVSLGHVTRKKEFRKAFAGSMLHVVFNLATAIVIFPLEYYWSLFSEGALYITSLIQSSKGFLPLDFSGIIQSFTAPVSHFLINLIGNYIVSLILSLILLVGCLKLFSILFKQGIVNNFMKKIEVYIFSNDRKALLWGILITALIHSSSIVTSFIVTMVASNRISLRKSFPFIMGANIGTTITALTASIGKPDVALAIAMVHLLINLISVLLVYPFPFVKNGIVEFCRKFGRLSIRYRSIGFAYVLILFFILPFLLIYFTDGKIGKPTKTEQPETIEKQKTTL